MVNDQIANTGKSSLRCAAVAACWLGLAALAVAEPSVRPEDLIPCPFSPEEIEAALGVAVEAGLKADMTFPEGRDVACTYPVRNSSTAIAVRQTVGVPQEATSRPERTRPVANDPFGAVWDLALENNGNGNGNGNGPKVALKYKHRGADTTLLVYGGYFSEPDMRGKVLRLKKVP